jgi:FtsP/CotA-like multicopper oxidase with cupredoxin domain
MNRRRFLAAGLASLGAACGASQVKSDSVSARVSLAEVRRLVAERIDPVAGRCRYVADLGARQVVQPILFARRGEGFDALIENALPQPTTVHFHGLTLSQAQDGAGFDPIPPGGRKRMRFEVRNRSGLYWFHPHPHGFTAEQVYAGLAGLLVVTDDEDQALDAALALAPGNRLALAVADVRVENGVIRPYAPGIRDCMQGWFGDKALANGRLDANWVVAPGWVRLQILNACNARGLLLGFQDPHADNKESLVPFHLLGTDGGLLAAPRALDRVFLHGAERVDVAIDVTGRRELQAVSVEFDARHHTQGAAPRHRHPARERYAPLAQESVCETPEPAEARDRPADGAELALFGLRVEGASARTSARTLALPARLSALSEPDPAPDTPTRRIRLDFDERTGFLIDQTPYAIDETGYSVTRGAREVWEIKNSPISMPHPMHVHGFGFRVLRRQGTFGAARKFATEPGGRFPTDLGIKDTVLAWPNETLWLALDFTLPRDAAFGGPQRYMFHCHNLEHEDGMMMRNITVV